MEENGVLVEEQNGFRTNRRGVDNMFVIRVLLIRFIHYEILGNNEIPGNIIISLY